MIYEFIKDVAAIPKIAMAIVARIMAIPNQIRFARAQLAFEGFTPELNAQTNSIICPTTGIIVMKMVMIQSHKVMEDVSLISGSILVFIWNSTW